MSARVCLPTIAVALYTAPYRWQGADRVDVTRRGARRAAASGKPLLSESMAPTQALLDRFLPLRDAVKARGAAMPLEAELRGAYDLETERLDAEWWGEYREAYVEFMRDGWAKRRRTSWQSILAHGAGCCGGELTLVCFCGDSARCHRSLAAQLLEATGARLGFPARYLGERSMARQRVDGGAQLVLGLR